MPAASPQSVSGRTRISKLGPRLRSAVGHSALSTAARWLLWGLSLQSLRASTGNAFPLECWLEAARDGILPPSDAGILAHRPDLPLYR
eukprot:5119305-Prymnesium_polylepis.1